MFFRKRQTNKPVPQEEIDQLISQGTSDRDIIKKLKSEGYSYQDIENAMMNAVKVGVSDTGGSSFPEAPSAPVPKIPDDFSDIDPSNVEELSPEQIVEELIEGVVDSKWKKFDEKIEMFNTEINSIKESLRDKPSDKSRDYGEYEERLGAMSSKIDELSARVGGLEKAFKQFLPSLTKNIESLSNIIHEMKMKERNFREA